MKVEKMSELGESKSISSRYKWQIIALIITSLLTIAGAIIRAQTQADLGLVMFIGGSLLSMTIFMGTLTLKGREDVDKIIKDNVGRLESEFRGNIEEIRNNLASVWTPTNERNIDVAQEITRKIGREGSNGLAYDTSSHLNPAQYENMVLDNMRKGVTYERLICFDPSNYDSPVAKWYFQLMNGEKDEEGRFDEWRKFIKEGRLAILHLPRVLDMDILVTNKKGTNKYDALLGFTTQETLTPGVYNSGLYVPAPTQMVDKNLANDIYSLFRKLWREAIRHALEQTQVEPEERCDCNKFVKEVRGDLVDIVPIERNEKDSN
jgi:hypothetical protein